MSQQQSVHNQIMQLTVCFLMSPLSSMKLTSCLLKVFIWCISESQWGTIVCMHFGMCANVLAETLWGGWKNYIHPCMVGQAQSSSEWHGWYKWVEATHEPVWVSTFCPSWKKPHVNSISELLRALRMNYWLCPTSPILLDTGEMKQTCMLFVSLQNSLGMS